MKEKRHKFSKSVGMTKAEYTVIHKKVHHLKLDSKNVLELTKAVLAEYKHKEAFVAGYVFGRIIAENEG